MKVVGILLKNNETDSTGIKNWLYVTKPQFEKIMDSQWDPELRGIRWAVKDRTFTVADIKETKEMDVDYAKTLPTWGKYIEQKVNEQILLEASQQGEVNEQGIRKLEDMKAKFQLNKGLE